MRKWIPIIILASGQFVMTLDTSVMNVSISQITADLNTSIQGVQAAITLYALVMAALMLTGAKLGDIYGRNRMFAIGLGVYGVGSLITALSPNLTVLLVGWSGIEGLGAIMVIPGIAALTAANYEGKDRAVAYALIGGITAVAVAAGPLIGGWVTTNASWRYVFAGETVIVTGIILVRGQIAQAPKAEHRPKMDVIGSVLSVAGLGLAVFGILMGSKWGFVKPLAAPTINGNEITPLGFSVVPFMVLAGLGILAGFVHWEERRHRLGLDRLLDTALLKITQLRAGLTTLLGQQLVLMGLFFVVPVYLQVVVGLDAFETGKRLLPLSVAMLITAMAGPKVAGRRSPRTVAQAGLVLISAGAVVMLATLDVNLNDTGFKIAMVLIGAGGGLARLPARQRDHVVDRPLQGERDRRPAGNGPQPRFLARHRPDRRDPDPQPDQRVQRQHRRQPAGAGQGARDDRHQHGGGHRHRARSPRSSSRRSRRASPRSRLRRWPATTAMRSSTRCGSPSAPSRSSRCSPSGSRGSCQPPPSRRPPSRNRPPHPRPPKVNT